MIGLLRSVLATTLIMLLVTGCNMTRKETGTVMGAGLGSTVGYTISEHPAGVVAGGVAGGYIGNRLAD